MLGRKKSNKQGKKQKKNWLERLGIEAEKVPTEDDKEREARHEKIVLVWKYVRDRIDKGVAEYFRTGSTDTLREFMSRSVLEATLEELEKMRKAGVYWAQPDRAAKTNPTYKVISEKLNKDRQPERFVIQERFEDHSVLRSIQGKAEKVANGTEHVIQATVDVENGSEFTLVSIIEIKGATL